MFFFNILKISYYWSENVVIAYFLNLFLLLLLLYRFDARAKKAYKRGKLLLL